MITTEEILKIVDASGPDAFEHMDFKQRHWTEFDYVALALVNDIYEYLQMKERMHRMIDEARAYVKEKE